MCQNYWSALASVLFALLLGVGYHPYESVSAGPSLDSVSRMKCFASTCDWREKIVLIHCIIKCKRVCISSFDVLLWCKRRRVGKYLQRRVREPSFGVRTTRKLHNLSAKSSSCLITFHITCIGERIRYLHGILLVGPGFIHLGSWTQKSM